MSTPFVLRFVVTNIHCIGDIGPLAADAKET